MIEAIGYSIWLEPEGAIKAKLKKIIDALAKEFKTPPFDPHITLLGGLSGEEQRIVEQARNLSDGIESSFTAELNGQVDCEEHWSKSLFIRVNETEKLMDANALSRSVFGVSAIDPYNPHLSLLYSENILLPERQLIAKNLNGLFREQFLVNKVHLYKTEGNVGEWRKIAEFDLR